MIRMVPHHRRKPGRKIVETVLLLCAFALHAGVGNAQNASAVTPPDTPAAKISLEGTTLRVGIFQDVSRAAIEATPFLKGTPYKIQWARLNGAGPTVQALGGNAIDISWGLSDTAPAKASAEDRKNWTAENAPIKLIALLTPVNTSGDTPGLIIANTKSGIRTLADLRGKTYAFNEGGNANARALLALDKAGLTLKDVKVRYLTSDALVPAVIAGAVDAAPADRSVAAGGLADGTIRQLATEPEIGFPGFVSVTARTASLKDPKIEAAVGDFLVRLAHYLQWAAAHPDVVSKAYVETQQLTPAQALTAARGAAYLLAPITPGTPNYVAEVNVTKKLGQLGFYPRPVDFATVVDSRYTKEINEGNRQ